MYNNDIGAPSPILSGAPNGGRALSGRAAQQNFLQLLAKNRILCYNFLSRRIETGAARPVVGERLGEKT
jgi:hypothetical protein